MTNPNTDETAAQSQNPRIDALLSACKAVADFSFTDYEARFNTTAALGRLVMLKRRARLAVAAFEQEAAQ